MLSGLRWRVATRLNTIRASFDQHRTRTRMINPGPKHRLNRPVILTLTSHGPRLSTVDLTLRLLLNQTVRPDRVILWLSLEDRSLLPVQVKRLEEVGLEIGTSENLGPHTKYYEARRQNPGAFIITADDDVIYGRDMVEQLVDAHIASPQAVITHRSRWATFDSSGPTPYSSWELVLTPNLESDFMIPMGVGGALYPPNSIPDEALNVAEMQRLSPRADDLWLFWMARRAGFTNRMVARPSEPRNWNGSERFGLWKENVQGLKNDRYLRALWDAYGFPERQRIAISHEE